MLAHGDLETDPARLRQLLREVNDRIVELARILEVDREAELVCECGADGCAATVPVDLAAYDETRRNARRFLLAPGHSPLAGDRVVVELERLVVVESESLDDS